MPDMVATIAMLTSVGNRSVNFCIMNEGGYVFRHRLRKLVMGAMTSLREHDQLHRRKFLGQRMPVLHRENEVVIAGNHQNRRGGGFQFVA